MTRPVRRTARWPVGGLVAAACLGVGAAAVVGEAARRDPPGSSYAEVTELPGAVSGPWQLVQGDAGEQGWVRTDLLDAARPPAGPAQVRLGVYTVDLRAAPDADAATVGTLTLHY